MALANQIGLSNKYVSERHAIASQSKLTAGEAAKILSKKLGKKILAKELVNGYKLLNGREPEWHHAGFYKSSGKSTMGRTFFFSEETIEDCAERWDEISEIESEIKAEEARKEASLVRGFYYSWDHDYSGSYGKKRNYKVLDVYEGSEANCPRNFTSCSQVEFDCASLFSGRKYYGWDEPAISEFSQEVFETELSRRHEAELIKNNNEAQEKKVIDFTVKEYQKLNDADKIIIAALLNDGGYGKNKRIPLLTNKQLGEAIIELPHTARRNIQEKLDLQFTFELVIIPQDLIDSINAKKMKCFEAKAKSLDTNTLLTWKIEGCIHPCPVEVLAAKKVSGLNWKEFVKSIK